MLWEGRLVEEERFPSSPQNLPMSRAGFVATNQGNLPGHKNKCKHKAQPILMVVVIKGFVAPWLC